MEDFSNYGSVRYFDAKPCWQETSGGVVKNIYAFRMVNIRIAFLIVHFINECRQRALENKTGYLLFLFFSTFSFVFAR